MITRRFLVAGRVQGVGFRWFVLHAAQRLGLSGWTRNLPDGRVEVLAQGGPDDVEALARDLARGPRHALVESLDWTDEPADDRLRDFTVRY